MRKGTTLFLQAASLGLLLLNFLFPTTGFGQKSNSNEALDLPVGAVAAFPKPLNLKPNEKMVIDRVFIRPDSPGNGNTWVAAAQEVLFVDTTVPAERNKTLTTLRGIGFVVPQLPKGMYVAWFASAGKNAGQSMRVTIVPRLLADQGIKRGVPGNEVQVRSRIYSPTVRRKDAADLDVVSVSVKLNSLNVAVADLAPGQSPTVRTDNEGYATWRVLIRGPGIAPFAASAEGFESITIDVVGMPGPGPTFREAELFAAQKHASDLDARARIAEARAEAIEESLARMSERTSPSGVAAAKEKEGPPKDALPEPAQSRAARGGQTLSSNAMSARAEANRAKQDAAGSMATAQRLATQLPSLQPLTLSKAELKPGDVFLVLGSSPLISGAITGFESRQLGTAAVYSHASLYLGELDGRKMVAEMWSSGFWITPLAVSTKGARIVDVYRWPEMDDRQRQELADRAANLFGPHAAFIRDTDPSLLSHGSLLPYAFEEIGALVTAATSPILFILQRLVRNVVDPLAGGRRKMICSELVAWVYDDVGRDISVTHWTRFNNAGLLTTNERRKDYTTPNMLARSSSLKLIGRFLGP